MKERQQSRSAAWPLDKSEAVGESDVMRTSRHHQSHDENGAVCIGNYMISSATWKKHEDKQNPTGSCNL